MAEQEFLAIGKVAKPHGLQGEISVVYTADSPFLLDVVSCIYLRRPNNAKPARKKLEKRTIHSWRFHKDRVLLTLRETRDRTAAEGLRGCELLVNASDIPREPGDVLLYELIGCNVFLPDGENVGSIIDILTPTDAQEIWVIHDAEDREILFPAHPDFVPELDAKAKRAVINPPPGLLELYTQEERE